MMCVILFAMWEECDRTKKTKQTMQSEWRVGNGTCAECVELREVCCGQCGMLGFVSGGIWNDDRLKEKKRHGAFQSSVMCDGCFGPTSVPARVYCVPTADRVYRQGTERRGVGRGCLVPFVLRCWEWGSG